MKLSTTTIACLSFAMLASSLPLHRPEKRALPRLGGFNIAGFDFGMDINGGFNGNYVNPITSANGAKGQINHFKATGSNIYRIPFGWQAATASKLGGTLDSTFFSQYDELVKYALGANAYVILDLHNYARWNGKIVGSSGGPSADQFANIWSQIAAKYATQSNVIFGLMNEPHDMPDMNGWNDWTHAPNWISGGNSAVLKVTDNGSSDVSKLLLDVHQQAESAFHAALRLLISSGNRSLDSDGSGTHTTCTTNNVDLMNNLASWLATNKRQAIVSETGAGSDSSCLTALAQQFDAIKQHSDTIVGFTVWSAGAFDSSYELSAVPVNGQDNALVKAAVNPYLPGNSGGSGSVPASTSSKTSSVAISTSRASASSRATSAAVTTARTTPTQAAPSSSTVRTTVTSVTRSTAATAATTSGSSTTGNLQKFSGKIGGIAAPAVTSKSSQYVQGTNTFNFLNDALARSCDDQMNACQAYANGSAGKTSGVTIQQCQAQQLSCYQSISA